MSNETPDPTERWCAFLDEARRLIDAQDTRAARATLDETIAYVDETWGLDDVHLIRPLRLMAESHFRDHAPLDPNNEREVECLQRALAVARRRLPGDHLEVAMLAGEVGTALVMAGYIDEGCELKLECLAIARQNGWEDDFLRYLPGLGHARMAQGRPAEALPYYERSASGYERRDSSSIVHAIARYHLGRCLHQLGRHQEAIDELQLALSVTDAKRVHGSHASLMNEIMSTIDLVKSELQGGQARGVSELAPEGKRPL